MKRKITITDVQNARRLHRKSIGKLNIEESIMKAIKAGLNESFSSWKEDNLPKFNTEEFSVYAAKLINAVNELMKQQEVITWDVYIPAKVQYFSATGAKSQIIDPQQAVKNIIESVKKIAGDGYAEAMSKGYLRVDVNTDPAKRVNFLKYLDAEKDPAQMDKIYIDPDKNICLVFKKSNGGLHGAARLYITFDQISKYADQIKEFIS